MVCSHVLLLSPYSTEEISRIHIVCYVLQGRRPSGGQKTVRELLHQNGQEPRDIGAEIDHRTEPDKASHYHMEAIKTEPSVKKSSLALPGASSQSGLNPASQPLLPNFNPAMFYPQLVPVAGAVPPMGLPFMIPQFGLQQLGSQVQQMSTPGNPIYVKDEKPLRALDKLVTSQQESLRKSAIHPPEHRHKPQSAISPPSAHSSNKYSSTHAHTHTSSMLPKSDLSQRPITPAHSNNIKREYPYPETNRNSHVYPPTDIKRESVHNKDLKRQKTTGSHHNVYASGSSGSNEMEMPVLDLSMKTMKAEEARHHRGESLLFDASFTKDHKFIPKAESLDIPQDLSVKSKGSTSSSVSMAHKGIPLNVPLPMSSAAGLAAVKREPVKSDVSF